MTSEEVTGRKGARVRRARGGVASDSNASNAVEKKTFELLRARESNDADAVTRMEWARDDSARGGDAVERAMGAEASTTGSTMEPDAHVWKRSGRTVSTHARGHIVNHAALWAAQMIWASMHVFSNRALSSVPPTAFCAFRLALGLPFLAYSARREGGRVPLGPLVRWSIPMGVAIGCAYLLVFVANERSGATLVASVQPIMPVSVALMSSALGLEPMGRMKALGVLVTTVGTITALRAYEVFQADGMNFVDAVCLLSQTNSYACYVVMLGLTTKRYPYPLLWLFTATLVAEIGITLIGIPTFRSFDARSVPASAWGAVVFAGIGSSVIAHSLNSWAIARVKGVLPTVYSGVQVIFTIILASIFLDERFSWDRGVGVGVTILGVLLVAKAKYRESYDARLETNVIHEHEHEHDAHDDDSHHP